MIDIWYEDMRSKINGMDCFFNDLGCCYSGNLYADGRAVGDYSVKNSEAVERIAAMFGVTWNWF